MKRLGARGILLIFACVVVVGFGLYMTWRMFQSALNPLPLATAPPPVTDKVLVTSGGIPMGSVLTSNDLVLVDVPVGLVPLSRMNDINQAIGKVSNVSMIAGEMVLPHHLVDPSNVIDRSLAFTLEDDQVLLAFPILDNVETPYRSLRGQQTARSAHGGAGTGTRTKRTLPCKRVDRG